MSGTVPARAAGDRVRVTARGVWDGRDVHNRVGTVVYVSEGLRWCDVALDGDPDGPVTLPADGLEPLEPEGSR